jgi:hypothetical protein
MDKELKIAFAAVGVCVLMTLSIQLYQWGDERTAQGYRLGYIAGYAEAQAGMPSRQSEAAHD